MKKVKARAHKIKEWTKISAQKLAKVKGELYARKAVVTPEAIYYYRLNCRTYILVFVDKFLGPVRFSFATSVDLFPETLARKRYESTPLSVHENNLDSIITSIRSFKKVVKKCRED